MARLRNLPSALAWALAIVIAYLERRDPARPRPAESEAGAAPPGSAPAPPPPDQSPPPAVERSEPAVAPAGDGPADDAGPGLAGAASTPPTATTAPPATPSTDDAADAAPDEPRSDRPTAAAPDPLVDTSAGETIVGPDAPIRHVAGGRPHVPAGAVAGDNTAECPPDYPIKGNATSMIYHQPGQPNYDRTIAELCFASVHDAEAAGYRPPKR
jgi:hypothetical protein